MIRGPPRCLLNKRAAEEIRKQEWLSEEVGEVGHLHVPLRPRNADKYGLASGLVRGLASSANHKSKRNPRAPQAKDLDEFNMKTGRKGRDFKECVKVAEWICIDEMMGLCRPQCFFLRFLDMRLASLSRAR